MPNCILLVDDSPAVRTGIRTVLECAGFEICGEAADGNEGIEKAELLHPDLIILDLSMPTMNGIDAARTLRKKMPSVPIRLLSNHVDAFRGVRPEGISALVSKDQSVAKLIHEAERLLTRAV